MPIAAIDTQTLLALIGVTLTVCVAFLGAIYAIVHILSDRIGDVVERLGGIDRKLDTIETRLDGIGNTLVRFDERLRQLEDHAR